MNALTATPSGKRSRGQPCETLIPIRPVSVINGLALILTVFPHTPFAHSVSDWQLAISVGGAMAFVIAGAVYALAARRQRAVRETEACGIWAQVSMARVSA